MPVDRKYERDIDLLLAEEFAVSPSFGAWFRAQTKKFSGINANVSDVHASMSDNTGESDLVVIFDRGDSRFALHIEDKIDAPLQHEQGKRYKLRADAAVLREEYSDYETILCSPEAYVSAHPDVSSFDSFVSYEAIDNFLRTHQLDDPRSLYRADFIANAARKSTNSWTRVDDPETNAFWNAAYDLATRDFPELEMRPLQLTKGSSWVTFRPQGMPARPKHTYISFKGDRGIIDLTFSNTALHKFSPLIEGIREEGMSVHQTGKSTAIRIRVEEFEIAAPNPETLSKLSVGFSASVRLIRFYRKHREFLDNAAAQSMLDTV